MAEYDEMGNYTGYDNYDTGYDYTAQPVAPQPISYDDFGNPVYNEEEERRKREEELRQIEEYRKQQEALGSEVTHKQEVTTYGDGSQTITTKREVPAAGQQQIQPVAPQSPEQARYNQSIAQQESGNRPNIGYHDQSKSTAYGPYGITAGAWQDARRANPYLPEDIRQATPEQMVQAQNTVTQNNARYLQSYGVPVNNNTLQAAHFLGAKGLSDYLKTGYISPAAAQANGGADRVRQIVNARLSGQGAAASGATQFMPGETAGVPTQPAKPAALVQTPTGTAEPATAEQAPRMAPNSYDSFGTPVYSPEQAQLDAQLKTFESIQNDPKALMNFEGPSWMQERAKSRAADILSDERDQRKAMESIQKADPKDLARTMMREPTDRWEIIKKSAMFRLLGAKDLADAELGKLGSTVEKYVQGADGKPYMLNMRPNGEVVSGINATTGEPMSLEEITKVGAVNIATKGGHMNVGVMGGAGTAAGKGVHVNKTESMTDPETKQTVTKMVFSDGTEKFTLGGKTYEGDTSKLIPSRITEAETKQGYRRENINANVMAAIQKRRGTDVMGALADFEAQSSVPVTDEMRMQFIRQYGGLAVPGTNGLAAPAGGAQQLTPVAPPAGTQTAPAAPAAPVTGVAPPQPTTNNAGNAAVTPAVPAKPGYDANGMPVRLPTEGAKAFEKRYKEWDEDQKTQRELGQKSSEAVIKHRNEKIVPEASAASEGSQIVKNQLKVLEDPKTDALFGLYNKAQSNSKADKNWAIVRDVISGKLETKEGMNVSEDWARTNLDPTQYSAWLAITSGNQKLATAEIKSGGFGAQISNADRASAEKMQIDIGNAPALGFYNQKAQQLYNFDVKRAKQAWAVNKQFKSPDELETEWSKESARLTQQYQDVADERNAFIKANSDNKAATPGLVREAYKRYPVPTFDPNLNNGQGGWSNPVRQRKLNQILRG